jgi:hypothetical protein
MAPKTAARATAARATAARAKGKAKGKAVAKGKAKAVAKGQAKAVAKGKGKGLPKGKAAGKGKGLDEGKAAGKGNVLAEGKGDGKGKEVARARSLRARAMAMGLESAALAALIDGATRVTGSEWTEALQAHIAEAEAMQLGSPRLWAAADLRSLLDYNIQMHSF